MAITEIKKHPRNRRVVSVSSLEGRSAVKIFKTEYKDARLGTKEAKYLIRHPGFRDYLSKGFEIFSMEVPDFTLAKSLLGNDFITPDEITKANPAIVYDPKHVNKLWKNQPSAHVFKWCKENDYVILPGPPKAMSTKDIREIPSSVEFLVEGRLVDEPFFGDDKISPGWLKIKKIPVNKSMDKDWSKQCELLSKSERIPNIAEVCWLTRTYFEVHGVELFKGISVRTSSFDISSNSHIRIVFLENTGLYIYVYLDSSSHSKLGMSAALK